MKDKDIIRLGELLVEHHNTTTKERCSLYGMVMDKALARDTFSTLWAKPMEDYNTTAQRLNELQATFIK